MKNEAYEWGYNYAAGQAAYENEQYMIVFCAIGLLVAIGLILYYVSEKISEYKEEKRRNIERETRKKRTETKV